MFKSERRSLIRFLLIYLGSTFLLFSLVSWVFYRDQKHQMLDQQNEILKYGAEQVISQLRNLHISSGKRLLYPKYPSLDSAIYDLDKNYIFGTFQQIPILKKSGGYITEDMLYYVGNVEPYYLGAAFIMIAKHIDQEPIIQLQKSIVWFMLGAGIFFTLLGLFLGKLFTAPMRESMTRMNHFIQDTTHELNTPISTILTNIEMLETFGKCEKNEELKRIEIASKTLSRIYDDLTFLNLNHNYHRHIEEVDLSLVLKERILYFTAMIESKGLKLQLDIHPEVILELDRNDAIRLIDNLISNAIKYNKHKGLLTIVLTDDAFMIRDTGIGIQEKDLETILYRFKRANVSEGGFGIGLDIVNQVVQNYGFVLSIHSQVQKGTEVEVKWSK